MPYIKNNGKKQNRRKPRPEPPNWVFLVDDNCWWCHERNGCSGCKYLKEYSHYQKEKQNRKQKSELRQIIKEYQ